MMLLTDEILTIFCQLTNSNSKFKQSSKKKTKKTLHEMLAPVQKSAVMLRKSPIFFVLPRSL